MLTTLMEILSLICCCGLCFKKQLKKRNKKDENYWSDKYGTKFETKNLILPINSPVLTKSLKVDLDQYQNKIEWYKAILEKSGYKFADEKPIGKGAFGEVYKILEINTNVIRAVKVMRLKQNKNQMLDENRFQVFKNEISSLQENIHPNIISLVDHFVVNDLVSFMVMEFATVGDLKSRLFERYSITGMAFPEDEANKYFVQVANAISFVHSKGLIHGDLKLENALITIDSNGHEVIKVSDFGCSRIAFKDEEGVLKNERAEGTLIYMAPEQIRVFITVNLGKPEILTHQTRKYNPFRADCWSLGICLYRLLFFEYPFKYDPQSLTQSLPLMLKKMKKGFDLHKNVSKTLSNECLDLLKSLLEYNKSNRIDMEIVMNHKWTVKSKYFYKVNKNL